MCGRAFLLSLKGWPRSQIWHCPTSLWIELNMWSHLCQGILKSVVSIQVAMCPVTLEVLLLRKGLTLQKNRLPHGLMGQWARNSSEHPPLKGPSHTIPLCPRLAHLLKALFPWASGTSKSLISDLPGSSHRGAEPIQCVGLETEALLFVFTDYLATGWARLHGCLQH